MSKKYTTTPYRIRLIEKRAAAMKLRKEGATYQEIAAQVGYNSASAAGHAVAKALSTLRHEHGDELLKLELERLDMLLFGHTRIFSGAPRPEPLTWPLPGEVDRDVRLKLYNQRQVEIDRHDQKIVSSTNCILRIMERRARLLGLDAPRQFEVNWREEAKQLGINPDLLLQQLVAQFVGILGSGATSLDDRGLEAGAATNGNSELVIALDADPPPSSDAAGCARR